MSRKASNSLNWREARCHNGACGSRPVHLIASTDTCALLFRVCKEHVEGSPILATIKWTSLGTRRWNAGKDCRDCGKHFKKRRKKAKKKVKKRERSKKRFGKRVKTSYDQLANPDPGGSFLINWRLGTSRYTAGRVVVERKEHRVCWQGWDEKRKKDNRRTYWCSLDTWVDWCRKNNATYGGRSSW